MVTVSVDMICRRKLPTITPRVRLPGKRRANRTRRFPVYIRDSAVGRYVHVGGGRQALLFSTDPWWDKLLGTQQKTGIFNIRCAFGHCPTEYPPRKIFPEIDTSIGRVLSLGKHSGSGELPRTSGSLNGSYIFTTHATGWLYACVTWFKNRHKEKSSASFQTPPS